MGVTPEVLDPDRRLRELANWIECVLIGGDRSR
jgi:hypothetical protein